MRTGVKISKPKSAGKSAASAPPQRPAASVGAGPETPQPQAATPQFVSLKASPFTYHGFTAWQWDLKTGLVNFTHHWAHLFSLVPEFPYQTTIEQCWSQINPDDMEIMEKAIGNIQEGSSTELDIAVRLRRADGGWAWTLSRAKVVEESEGGPLIVCGVNVTISRLRSDPVFQQNGIVGNNIIYQATPGIVFNRMAFKSKFPVQTTSSRDTDDAAHAAGPANFCAQPSGVSSARSADGGRIVAEKALLDNIVLEASPFTYYDFTAWKWDPETNLVSFTHDWAQLFRVVPFTPFQTTLEQCWNQVCVDDREALQEAFGDIMDGRNHELDVAVRLRRPDGGWAWTLSRGSVLEENEGRPVMVGGVNLTISQLRSDPVFQQSGIGASNTAYHAMLENSPDMIVRMDRELFPLYMNPKVGQYFKRQREDFTGYDTVAELEMDPRQMEFLLHYIEKVFSEKVTIREMLTFKNSYGHHVTGEYSFWPEFDIYGNVVSVMTQFRDMTEQIQAEERARLNESRLNALNRLTQMEGASEEEIIDFVLASMRDLTDSFSSAMFIPSGKVTESGRFYWLMNDFNPGPRLCSCEANVLPKAIMDILCSGGDNPVLRGIVNGDGESTLFEQDKWKVPVRRIAVAPSINDNRVTCLAVVCNKDGDYNESDLLQIETFINGAWLILQRFQHLRELQQAKEMAEKANRTRAAFLANVNHELRTPLASILGYTERLISLCTAKGEEQDEAKLKCLEVIHRNSMQMRQLVEDLLFVSRSEGTRPLKLGSVKLKKLVDRVAEAMQPQISAWNLRLDIDIPDELYIYADQQAISQVFINLLENACRYAQPETNIEIRASKKNGKEVFVSVRDYGTGIDPEDMARLFDRFYSGKQQSNNHKSMGLGLAICKYLLDFHGGRIWAENSSPGTTFYFSLPHTEASLG